MAASRIALRHRLDRDRLHLEIGPRQVPTYQIVDRLGIRVLRDPYSEKPFIQFYTTRRVGGAVVNFEAYLIQKLA